MTGNNAYGSGGGGLEVIGALHVEDSTIHENRILESEWNEGGGARVEGTLTMLRSTVSGNFAVNGGGLALSDDATIVNSTISGNDAMYRGAGIQVWSAEADLVNVTITENELLDPEPDDGAGLFSNGWVTMVNTIVAGNVGAADCHLHNAGAPLFRELTSLGHNLDGDDSCFLIETTDLPGTDPLLGPLADNGGPTQTHALLSGSPAIAAGDAAACPTTDQRGAARPQGAGCDIGAFELVPSADPDQPPVVTGTPDRAPDSNDWYNAEGAFRHGRTTVGPGGRRDGPA